MKALLALAAVLTLSACTGEIKIDGKSNGPDEPVKSEARDVAAFDRIESSGSADIRLTVGPETSVKVDAPSSLLDNVQTEVSGDTLEVRTSGVMLSSGSIVVTVTTPTLSSAKLSGSGDLDAKDLRGESFELRSSGSGDAELAGTVTTLSAKTSGSGDLEARALSVQDASIRSSGSGDVELNATGNVKGKISGSGDLSVVGGGTCDVSSSGSGDVEC